MQNVDFLKNVLTSSDVEKLLLTRPARFMIQECYIVGGLGAYALGTVLCGVIKQKEEVVLQPGDLKSEIGFLEKDRALVKEAHPGETVAMNLPRIKASKLKRGMILSLMSDKPSQRAMDLEYALGFFIGADFNGHVVSGMRFFLVHNKIPRKCRIEV
jgi:translation elongation factor EF-1alpha